MSKDVSKLLKGADRELAQRLARDPGLLAKAIQGVGSPVADRLEGIHDHMRNLTSKDCAVEVNTTSLPSSVTESPEFSVPRTKPAK